MKKPVASNKKEIAEKLWTNSEERQLGEIKTYIIYIKQWSQGRQ